jgi:hypothetical protein
MARGCALIDSRLDTAKICSDGRVHVDHAQLPAVFGGEKTFSHGLDPKQKFGLVTKFDILIRAKRNGLERPSERALQSLTGVRIEPAPVAENDAFWLP